MDSTGEIPLNAFDPIGILSILTGPSASAGIFGSWAIFFDCVVVFYFTFYISFIFASLAVFVSIYIKCTFENVAELIFF